MNTRNYFTRQTKVRNVRRPKTVTVAERFAAWRQSRADDLESDEPPRPRVRWVRIVGVLAALACVTQLVYAAGIFTQYTERTQHLHVNKFQIAGQKRMTEQEIIDASGVKPGASLTSLNPLVVQHNVEALPWIQSARVEAQLPSTLAIYVAEYRPFALILSATGKLLIVDRGGFVFKQAEGNEAGDLPIVTGLSAGLSRDVPVVDQGADKENRPQNGTQTPTQRRLRDLLHLIDAHTASPLASRFPLSEVHWDPVMGTTLISANDGAEIRLGHALDTDLGRAFSLMGRLLDRVDSRGEWLQYALLDDEVRQDRAVVRALPLANRSTLTQAASTANQVGGAAAAELPQAGTMAQAGTATLAKPVQKPLMAEKPVKVDLGTEQNRQDD